MQVLVLNSTYLPLNICSWKRGLILVLKNKATIVETSKRIINHKYIIPSVVKLNRYIPLPFQEVVLTRKNVYLRDNYECQYCGKKNNLTIDHVIPRSRGGKDVWTNVVVACTRCNNEKGRRTPQEAGLNLKNIPYKPPSSLYLEMTTNKDIPHNWFQYFDKLRKIKKDDAA
ncbi:MAG: HNH endonuclease [Candidatus Margulisbacteria bacterium]|nr:HNH endonuclease [Candidatus Margulisiibacteriota bacterium]